VTRRARKEAVAAAAFLLPNFVGFLVFMALPTLASLGIAFTAWRLLDTPRFVGFDNFAELARDPLFYKSLGNTATYVFGRVPINLAISLALAVLLNRKVVGRNFVRVVLFLPVVCSNVAVALMWQPLFDPTVGLLNKALSLLGVGPIPWITSAQWAMPSVIMVGVWKEIGYFMVIFLAGLQGISSSYYEAARIDGANAFQEFRAITLPLISPATFFCLVTAIIFSFQVFDITTVLTNGGPGNATNTVVMLIYQNAFRFFRMGYASASAYVLFFVVLTLTIMQNQLAKRWVFH
jgi:multiple sugar transport system permease protein